MAPKQSKTNLSSSDETSVVKGGYWRSSKADTFPVDSIQTQYFTHLFYATVEIDPLGYEIPISSTEGELMTKFTSTLSSAVKCFLSIGQPAGDDGSANAFSAMASTDASRATFIKSSIIVARSYNFDGLDLYWKYPVAGDMPNLMWLFREWHDAIQEESLASQKPPLLLSAVVYFAPNFFPASKERAYPFDAINQYVDFVNLVCYDYYGPETPFTADHAKTVDAAGKKSNFYGYLSWINDAKVPATKLVMGLPLYGRTWTLVDPKHYYIGAPANGAGPGVNGVMHYTDIINYNNEHQITPVYEAYSSFSHYETDWIGYDTPGYSLPEKVLMAKNTGLVGYFFWALDMDINCELPSAASTEWDKDSSRI